MNKRTLFALLATALLAWSAPARAGEVDILVQKLVEKGVLNQQDADVILQETKVEAEKERKETVAATKEALLNGKDGPFMLAEAVPAWIKNTQIKGDFRLRYESVERDGQTDRHRGRYRFRLGFVTKVNDKVEVGYGLATGDGNPRSTEQSFTNSFETPDIRLDYAYASYRPFSWLQLIGGQMINPLWTPGGSFLWDSDIRPQGVSAVLNRTVGGVEVFLNSGFWVLDEIGNDSNDPTMWVVQPGYKINLGKRAYFKNAVALYEFSNVRGSLLDYSSNTNTRVGGVLAEDYDSVVVSGELGYNTGISFVPFVAGYGEYVNNRATSKDDSGYGYGIKFGHEKVKKGLWQASLHYHRLERDAWLDTLPDGSTYGGATNMKAIIALFTYGLLDNVDFAPRYTRSEPLSPPKLEEDLWQVDVIFKF